MAAWAHVTVRCPACGQPFKLAARVQHRATARGLELHVGRPDTSPITSHAARAHTRASAAPIT
ncbi:hypothetical protein [Streptomyces parvulus]|uniref:hypothetical protein n=1 Tax=Streptomyces parvulus TaxID=146923 RepID=UPI0033B42DAB